MNKRTFKSYVNKAITQRPILENCFKYGDKFLISDTYSIVILNKNYDLGVKEDTLGLSGFLLKWSTMFEDLKEIQAPIDKDKQEPIDNDFCINNKLFLRIKRLISANKFTILENKDKNEFMRYLIKLENTKTKEKAYLLPSKMY